MPHAVVKTEIYPLQYELPAVTGPKPSGVNLYIVRESTPIDSILLGSVLVHSAALLSTHASVSNKQWHRQYYDTI
jgi:hypothetical protein